MSEGENVRGSPTLVRASQVITICDTKKFDAETVTTDAPGITLAGHSRASKLQAGSADPPVSARQGASVPIKLLHSSQSSQVATRRHLRSAVRHQLTVPLHRLSTYGRRTFAVAGPTMFNTLPDNLRDPVVSTSTFGQSLKTHLLFSAYQHV